ncbi:MAG: hypothetical protein JSV99_09310 [Planctomycetota bacterium]|nr:MAG: hypothetical protein JSV99_09310 [Planctomycetota bacterium]
MSRQVKTALSVIAFVLVSLFLIYWRVPRDVSTSSGAARTAFVLSAFLFLLSAPCFYLVLRAVFGEFLGVLFSVFYVLLAVFPYKLFYGAEVALNKLCFEPVPTTMFGSSGIWVVVLYLAVSLLITSAYWFYKKGKLFPVVEKGRALIFVLLLLAVLIQVLPRLGGRSPKAVRRDRHRPPAERTYPYRTQQFYGVETGGADVWHHVGPSGMFRGDFRVAKGVVINRRGFGPYQYSLISTYFHPYYAAIIVNAVFYYMIVVCGYLLAKQLNLNESIAIAYSVLLSANYFILNFTLEPVFYVQYFAFIILVLLLIPRLGVFEDSCKVKNKVLFCFVLACCGLTYDAFVFSGILLLWGFFHSFRVLSEGVKKSLGGGIKAVALAVVPLCSQYLWEVLLRFYDLQGMPDNIEARANLLEKLFLLPRYIYTNFWEFGALVSRNIIRLVVENPVLPAKDLIDASAHPTAFTGECTIEYWSVLGLAGVFSLFVLLPRYLSKEHKEGIYACYISNLSIGLLSSLAAAIAPLMKYHWIFLAPSRTNNAYPVLILAQSVGIYHITKFCCDKFKIATRTQAVVVVVAVVIYMLSFVRLLFL